MATFDSSTSIIGKSAHRAGERAGQRLADDAERSFYETCKRSWPARRPDAAVKTRSLVSGGAQKRAAEGDGPRRARADPRLAWWAAARRWASRATTKSTSEEGAEGAHARRSPSDRGQGAVHPRQVDAEKAFTKSAVEAFARLASRTPW